MEKVLNDKRSWGPKWTWVPKATDAHVVQVYLVSNAMIVTHLGRKFSGFSVADTSERPYKIYFNAENWASVPPASEYKTLSAYRTYVVNHEFGHILGHEHEKCRGPNSLAPVMLQQTVGQKGCVPNPWPRPI